jgi:hypothetical protein
MQVSLPLLSALASMGTIGAPGQETSVAVAEPLEQVVPAEWMPLPVFVAAEVRKPRGLGALLGDALRSASVQHRVVDGVLEIDYSRADASYGKSLTLRLERASDGRVSMRARGAEHSCVSSGAFFDLHGEVVIQRRTAGSADPLRLAFLVDAIEDGLLGPVRVKDVVEVALEPGEWDAEIVAPPFAEPEPTVDPATLREVWWRWSDGKPRAHGHVDASGRRHGLWETWTASGDPESATEFLAGERHGLWRTFEGTRTTEGRLEHGVEQGEWVTRFEDGEWRRQYEHGVMVER